MATHSLPGEAEVRLISTARTGIGDELRSVMYTVRAYEHGYLMRVIEGDHGVFITTDQLVRDRFEELAVALRRSLRDLAMSTP